MPKNVNFFINVRIGRRRSRFRKVLMKYNIVELEKLGQLCLYDFFDCLGEFFSFRPKTYQRHQILNPLAPLQ